MLLTSFLLLEKNIVIVYNNKRFSFYGVLAQWESA